METSYMVDGREHYFASVLGAMPVKGTIGEVRVKITRLGGVIR